MRPYRALTIARVQMQKAELGSVQEKKGRSRIGEGCSNLEGEEER